MGLWIDFTFPDDVMVGKTLAERRDFANECLKKLKRFIHKQGLKEIWKKEFTTRKSGKLKGLYLPHCHNLQNEISEACGYEYDEFLSLGKTLIQGKENKPNEQNIIHLDPAVQILQEALEETGVKINEKQKHACLKILREDIEKLDSKTKEDIKKYLKAFGNER